MPHSDIYEIDLQRLPAHVGIIMDGNGRWAIDKKMHRTQGHREGLKTTKKIVQAASELGIKYLSIYTFSTENWKRTKEEISYLMGLVRQNLKKELDFYKNFGIRIIHSGTYKGLQKEIQEDLEEVQEETKDFDALTLNLVFNYGGRDEIIRAVNKWISQNWSSSSTSSSSPMKLRQEEFYKYLDVPDLPEPDLIIRTGGEIRLSNFLLWESAYSELYFSEKLWPDWTPEDFYEAILAYQKRERKYGGVK